MTVLRRFVSQPVQCRAAVVAGDPAPCRPARIQRVKRPNDGQQLRFAVGVVGKAQEHRDPAAAQVPVLEIELRRRSIDTVDPLQPQKLTAAEEVGLLDTDSRPVLAAAAGERDIGRQ